MQGYIYIILDKETNRVYVGRAQEPEKRFRKHRYELKYNRHHNIFLQRVYNKRPESLEYIVLGLFDDVCKWEIFYINKTMEMGISMNISRGSDGGDNLSNNPNRNDIIQKITNSIIERYKDPANRAKHSRPGDSNPNFKHGNFINFGERPCSNDCGNMIKSIGATTCNSCRAKDKTGDKNSFYGKSHSDETKRRMSDQRKGKRSLSMEQFKPFRINGKIYLSLSDASKELDVVPATISNRLKNKKYLEYEYITDETEVAILFEQLCQRT